MLCVIYAKKENSIEADGGTRYVYVAQKQQHKKKEAIHVKCFNILV